jgi:hypothetical protein
MSAPTVKVQGWADDLRLPCLTKIAEYAELINTVEPLRRPALPFQSKHLPALKRDTWFVLQRKEKTRPGLLVIWPQYRCCVYISNERTPRVALLRLRIDPQFYGGGLTVFGATLSSRSRRISVEDTYMWKGRRVIDDDVFAKRWALAVQWIEHYCLLEELSGLSVEMANWRPLETLRPVDAWDLQPNDTGRSRYTWIAGRETQVVAAPPVVPSVLVALAERDTGPEQWVLKAGDGSSLGRGLVRTLATSDVLRSAKQVIRVIVVWNPDFMKWEIKEPTEKPVTHGAAIFEASK